MKSEGARSAHITKSPLESRFILYKYLLAGMLSCQRKEPQAFVQIVIAVPESPAQPSFLERLGVLQLPNNAEKYLLRPVCGIPLLTRVLATVRSAGANEVFLIWPSSLSAHVRERVLRSNVVRGLRVVTLITDKDFDPAIKSNWLEVRHQLPIEFVWLPWNWVTTKECVTSLERQPISFVDWSRPAIVDRSGISAAACVRNSCNGTAPGVAVVSPETALDAERFLVTRSQKVAGRIDAVAGRYCCQPVVRHLARAGVSPTAMSVGLMIAGILSSLAYLEGSPQSYVIGALLFLVAGFCDQVRAMLARVTFSDTPFGTWFEGFTDGLSYFLQFGSISVGLYRQHSGPELRIGLILLAGMTHALIVAYLQRRSRSRDAPFVQQVLNPFKNGNAGARASS